jgi:hypothetical protein
VRVRATSPAAEKPLSGWEADVTERKEQQARTRAWRRVLPLAVLVVLLVGGTVLRVDHTRHCIPFNDDYGTAALMSQHISELRTFPLYFYGYGYISALGAYVGAVMFALFGPSFTSLGVATIPFWMLWFWVTYLLFRRLVGVWAGVVAAALVAFPPFEVFHSTTLPLLGYPPTLAFGTLLLYFGHRLHARDLTPRAEWGCLVGMAVVAGLAIWTHPLSVPFHVAALVLLAAYVVRSRFRAALLLKLAVASMLLVVSLLPVFITAAARGASDLFGHWPFALRVAPDNALMTVTNYIPNQLLAGAPMPSGWKWLVASVYAVLGAVFVSGAVYGLVMRRAQGRAAAARRATAVPLLFAAAFLALFVPNSMASDLYARYFTPFYICVVACFAFPFVFRRPLVGAAAGVLAAFVIVYNVVDVVRFVHGPASDAIAKGNATIERLVHGVEQTGVRHVLVEDIGPQTLTFVSRERVIFATTLQERYYPYAVGTAADDHTGFLKRDGVAPRLPDTFAALGITRFKTMPFPELGVTLFYDLELPPGRLRLVEPKGARLVHADGAVDEVPGLIDRQDETVVGDRFDAAGALIIDFGEPVELAAMRLVAPRPEDYPAAYTLFGSIDGTTWREIQRVEDREPMACIYGNRLYYRGHATVMECRFGPTTLRALKIAGLRTQAEHHQVRRYPFRVWRLSEAFFYAPDERETASPGRPDEAEARAIARELHGLGVRFVVADEYLSRKIEQLDEPHPKVWRRYEWRHPASHISRIVPVETGVAIVVESAHADAAGERLADTTLGEVQLDRHDFDHYTAYVIARAPTRFGSFPGLRWNGFTVVATVRIATAGWYHGYGRLLSDAGRADEARRFFKRSFDTFPGIMDNLQRLAPDDEAARHALESLTPEHEARARFPHGVSLVGYTFTPSPLVPGEQATLRLVWELDGTVKHDFMQVFVHFLADDERVFQADHNAVFPVAAGSTVPPARVLDEHTFLVPRDVPAGTLTIQLGATSVADRSVRLKPRTRLPVRSRAVEIGRVEVAR